MRLHQFRPVRRYNPLTEESEDTGLSYCEVCNGAEGTLTTECPGAPVEPRVAERVYAGVLDYSDGCWKQRQRRGLVIRMPIQMLCNPQLSDGRRAGHELQQLPGLDAVERWGRV